MDDFGEARFILSSQGQMSMLVCESRVNPDHFYLFKKKKVKRLAMGGEVMYSECISCHNHGNPMGRAIVREGRVKSNPDHGHNPLCEPFTCAEVEAKRIKREGSKVQKMAINRFVSTAKKMAEIPRQFPMVDLQNRVEELLPTYASIRPTLYKATAKRLLPIPDLANLPHEYQLTTRGREAFLQNQPEIYENENFLLYNVNGLMIFGSNLDLFVLHESEFWICDGTFEMCPVQFSQIYTIHGSKNGECIPCCHALLPDRRQHTYGTVFREVNNAIVGAHGNLGRVHTILFNFEIAAHQAAQDELPGVITRGCTFHFGQALIRNIQRLGLMIDYENQDGEINHWVKLIKAMCLLPVDLVIPTWQNWLHTPPQVDNPLLQQKLNDFVTYFENTWLNGRWQVSSWNHFANEWRDAPFLGLPGPHTTNHAEGWHNRLNHDFGHPCPRLNTFLDWLQQTNNVNQVRIRQLLQGENPRRRMAQYIQTDANISRAKYDFLQRRGGLQNA